MSETVIRVENISKQYRLGEVSTGSLGHDLNVAWHRIRGKDNPYLKIGDVNDRTKKGSSEYVWALKDINFDVKQGEVLGLIGRNGAGKSTLLKILSKTTAPTTGQVLMKGRVASLLEVGTGFHPDLSGRDNIFLNGAILGMTRNDIKKKFDEIVDFAGVERYIDTPVKRYSSGMYVRLAFGVAAHLEPEILIVDEVLAVGDAEFQKKCLGKMKDVSEKDGRTVLFVSHNLSAIQSLCSTAILIKDGRMEDWGEVEQICNKYTGFEDYSKGEFKIGNVSQDAKIDIEQVRLYNSKNEITGNFDFGDNITVEVTINCKSAQPRPYIWMMIKSKNGNAFNIACGMIDGCRPDSLPAGVSKIKCTFNRVYLFNDVYTIQMGIRNESGLVGLTNSVDVARFVMTTLPSELSMNGTLADIISKEVPPLYPSYDWEFAENPKQSFRIENFLSKKS